MTTEINQLKGRLHEIDEKRAENEAQIKEHQTTIDNMEKTLVALEDQMKVLQDHINQAFSESEELRMEVEELSKAVEDLKKDIAAINTIIAEGKNSLDNLKEESKRTAKNIAALTMESDALTRRINEEHNRIFEDLSKINSRESKIENLEQEIERIKEAILEIEKEENKNLEEIAHADKELKENMAEDTGLGEEEVELVKRIANLTEELNECKDIPPKKSACKNEAGVSREPERNQIQQQIQQARSRLSTVQGRRLVIRDMIRELKRTIEKCNLDNQYLTAKKGWNNEKMQGAIRKKTQAEAELKSASKDLQETKGLLSKNEGELNKVSTQIVFAQSTKEQIEVTLAQQSANLSSLGEKLSTQEEKKKNAIANRSHKNADLKKLEDKKKEKTKEISTLTAEINKNKKEMNALQDQVEVLERERLNIDESEKSLGLELQAKIGAKNAAQANLAAYDMGIKNYANGITMLKAKKEIIEKDPEYKKSIANNPMKMSTK